ncbi:MULTISPECIES: SET domain-containing protein-lysine N-methyltransferase [Paraburkholderia]|uniref:SET domain-containing protein-lysine N-methyltransferase n=1 Tax=Paraburkholderia TaxID=1822464 RepID=UPI00224D5962|nr:MULTISPECIES: SET domain-containing protein [Paraburkholderia]MCX4159819.1 SET domain-containing protein [Paraburkholderia aspalathi]MDN7169216.1 SET domain-containing protein [Paraburkholderia sp. SECH2]MDQ6397704.1 SET domain-containing protein [Paraburkholderia aspalathi]
MKSMEIRAKDRDEELVHLAGENFEIKPSRIHGRGLFSERTYPKRFEMGVAFVRYEAALPFKDHLGENRYWDLTDEWSSLSAIDYVNHSSSPNLAVYKKSEHLIIARCLRNIRRGDEITLDYRQVCKLNNMPVPEFCREQFRGGWIIA